MSKPVNPVVLIPQEMFHGEAAKCLPYLEKYTKKAVKNYGIYQQQACYSHAFPMLLALHLHVKTEFRTGPKDRGRRKMFPKSYEVIEKMRWAFREELTSGLGSRFVLLGKTYCAEVRSAHGVDMTPVLEWFWA